MADLFGVQLPAIGKHLKNVFEEGELKENVAVSKMEISTPHGERLEKDGVYGEKPLRVWSNFLRDLEHGTVPTLC